MAGGVGSCRLLGRSCRTPLHPSNISDAETKAIKHRVAIAIIRYCEMSVKDGNYSAVPTNSCRYTLPL